MKLAFVLIFIALLSFHAYSDSSPNSFSTPVNGTNGKAPTINNVWPVVDALLKNQYWYYLRNATTIYQASVNTVS